MRYFTIPFLSILYIMWSYRSIRSIYRNGWDIENPQIILWFICTIMALLVPFVLLNVFYW